MAPEVHQGRAYVYVDGFNFYHAALDDPAVYPYGWCNWKETAQNYCGPNTTVAKVKYFTSRVRDARKSERQELHIKAMKTIAQVILGEFATSPTKKCAACNGVWACQRCGSTERTVEKKTDVNIAVEMVLDAANRLSTEAFLVTADRDLLPAVEAVLDGTRFPGPPRITVLFPPGRSTQEFLQMERRIPGLSCKTLSTAKMVRFPEQLASQLGFKFPDRWKLAKRVSPLPTKEVMWGASIHGSPKQRSKPPNR